MSEEKLRALEQRIEMSYHNGRAFCGFCGEWRNPSQVLKSKRNLCAECHRILRREVRLSKYGNREKKTRDAKPR